MPWILQLLLIGGSARERRRPAHRPRQATHCCVRGLLRLRGGSDGHEYTDHSLQQRIRRLQAVKDQMLAALERGDNDAAREYARELATLKAKVEKRLARLQQKESSAAGDARCGGSGVAGAGVARGGMGGMGSIAGTGRVGSIGGMGGNTHHGPARPVHYPSFLRRMEEEIARHRAQLEAETRKKVAEARAREPEAAVERDEHGRVYADEFVHGVCVCVCVCVVV